MYNVRLGMGDTTWVPASPSEELPGSKVEFPKLHVAACNTTNDALNQTATWHAEGKQIDILRCTCYRGQCQVQALWCQGTGSMQAARGHE